MNIKLSSTIDIGSVVRRQKIVALKDLKRRLLSLGIICGNTMQYLYYPYTLH